MSLVSNNKQIFLCSNTKLNVSNKVNIILSPEFYWVRIFDIPVNNITQARHVLPTLFEDILENTSVLSYQVIKLQDNKYLCFAYENKKIFEEIKKSGLALSLVKSIYFAQTECKNYSQFLINDKSFMYTNDDILVKVPNGILNNAVNLDEYINAIDLTSNKVDIKLYNNVLNTKQIYSIVIVLFIIASINIFKLYDYKSETTFLNEKIKKLKTINKLPPSMIQTNAIIKKYQIITSREKNKREVLSYVLVNKKLKLKKINLEKNMLSLDFINTDKNQAQNYISQKYNIVSINVNSLVLNVKIKL